MKDFDERLSGFLKGVRDLINMHYATHCKVLKPPEIEVSVGRRYVKVIRREGQSTVYCFVQRDNGDVLKAESWSRPAMHKRSNIYDPDYGMSGVTEYGARYL